MPQLTRSSFHVAELDCAEEAAALRHALEGRPGVHELHFDFLRARMDVDYDASSTSPAEILKQVSATGMHGRPWAGKASLQQARAGWRLWLALAAAALTMTGFVTHWWLGGNLAQALGIDSAAAPGVPWAARILYSVALILGLVPVVPRALAAIRRLRPDMYVLVCAAVVGAIILGEWLEAATVSCLFAVALLLDQWSLDRARRAISSLMNLAPDVARCRTDEGTWVECPVEEVEPARHVLVQPGERIPVDGRVIAGQSSVNQAAITGESQPVFKEPGSEVYAGTLNNEGSLEVIVTRPPNDSTLARILHMVEEAQTRRAPSEQWVEKFARVYTPAMMALAVLLALLPPLVTDMSWTDAVYNALVLLVIACPCALVISTPVTMVSALAAAARAGILIKGGRHLEACAGLQAMAFDKTGTLTHGQPIVESVVPLHDTPKEYLLSLAATLESQSTHPLAQAIEHTARAAGAAMLPMQNYRVLSGRGVEALVNERPSWLGGDRLIREKASQEVEHLQQLVTSLHPGSSLVALGEDHRVLGYFVVTDQVREHAQPAIAALRKLGIRFLVMLTGDNAAAAAKVAAATGVDTFLANALPEDKVHEVDKLRATYHHVAMVGDGINDSPALAAATVGIAMAAIGSDTALETADVALMADDLSRLPWLVAHARRAARTVRQNIALALGTKVLFVALAFLGAATLWSAIAADMGVSLVVIFNGLRLCRGEPAKPTTPDRRPLTLAKAQS